MHCKQDPINVFPEMKQCGLIPNFYILRAIVGIYKTENLQIAATYFAIHLIELTVNWKKVELRFISFITPSLYSTNPIQTYMYHF